METEEDGKGEVVKGLSRDAMIFEGEFRKAGQSPACVVDYAVKYRMD